MVSRFGNCFFFQQSTKATPIILIVFMLVSVTGCALSVKQKTAVSQFSSAAANLGEVTTSELKTMRDNTIKITIERLLLGGKSKNPSLGDQTSLDRGFEVDRVEAVSGATRALGAYGKSLAALVDDTQSVQLKAASNEFITNLGSVPGAKGQLSDKQMDAIGSTIQEVGGFLIEYKRKQAVIKIVKESEKAVDHLCDLLVRDFDEQKGWIFYQLNAIEQPLMAEATNGLYDGRTYNDRKIALDAFLFAHDNKMRRTEVLKRVVNAATAMKKANAELVKAVNDASWSEKDILEFAEKAKALQTSVKIIAKE